MTYFFVTGSGTDVGKTVVTAFLAKFLQDYGRTVTTQKWVQTGVKDKVLDLAYHDQILGSSLENANVHLRQPYSFAEPVAPHLAANWAGVELSESVIVAAFQHLKNRFESVVVEGAGGALVPLALDLPVYMIDVAIRLGLESVVVVPNQVGAIHAAVSTVESILSRSGKIACVVLTQLSKDVELRVLLDNQKTLTRLLRFPIIKLEHIPSVEFWKPAYSEFIQNLAQVLVKKR